MFAGLHRERRESGVVGPVVDLEAVLHHQRVGAVGSVVDGIELGLHPGFGAHLPGQAVFVKRADERKVGVVVAGNVAEGEILAGVLKPRNIGNWRAGGKDGIAPLGTAGQGRTMIAVIRRAEIGPDIYRLRRPDSARRAGGIAVKLQAPQVGCIRASKDIGAKIVLGGIFAVATGKRPDTTGSCGDCGGFGQPKPTGNRRVAVERESGGVGNDKTASILQFNLADHAGPADATVADAGHGIGAGGRIGGIGPGMVFVASRVDRRPGVGFVEVPDADIVRPHVLRGVARRQLAFAQRPVHADRRIVGEDVEPHPDERFAVHVPGVDLVGQRSLGDAVNEHHVLAGTAGAAVVEAAQAALADADEKREVGERLGAAVALDAQVDVVAEDAVGVAPDGELDHALGGGPIDGLGDGGADVVDADVGRLVFHPRAGFGRGVVDTRLTIPLPVRFDGDRVLHRHFLHLPARKPEGGDGIGRLGDGPVKRQRVRSAGRPAVVGRVIEDEGGLVILNVHAANRAAVQVIARLVVGVPDAVLNGAIVDEGDGGRNDDRRLVDAPFNDKRIGSAGGCVPDVIIAVERESCRVTAGISRVGDAAAFKVA